MKSTDRRPLCIYVLWHHASKVAPKIADTVYHWFQAPTLDVYRSGLGVPLFFRCEPFQEDGDGDREHPCRHIDLDGADLNLVFALVEDEMVADKAWRDLLLELATSSAEGGRGHAHLYPVALAPSAYRLDDPIGGLNYLRLPAGVDADAPEALALLRRQLTEVVTRHVLSHLHGRDASTPLPVQLFISHAKADGLAIARTIRDRLPGYGQVRAFFDENDLPLGRPFGGALEEAARGDTTAAMICVFTDAYAGRPWCRAEVDLARRPRRDGEVENVWRVQPVLVASHLSGDFTRGLPALGAVPCSRWRDGGEDELVDRMMLEVLLAAYHQLAARKVASKEGRHVISWVPDAHSLLSLQGRIAEPWSELVYPGHALPKAELAMLERCLNPHGGGELSMLTFEQAHARDQEMPSKVSLSGWMGLSLSNPPNLAMRGYGVGHIDAVVSGIVDGVLDLGLDIAYGGAFRSKGFIETLIGIVRSHDPRRSTENDDGDEPRRPRMVNYLSWPYELDLDARRIAGAYGTCRFVRIREDAPRPHHTSNESRVRTADSAQKMRRAMLDGATDIDGEPVEGIAGRIVLGGQITGWSGYLPGIVEEVVGAIEAGRPVYVLGGWGGAARLIARVLRDGTLPPELTLDWQRRNHPKLKELEAACKEAGEADRVVMAFERAHETLVNAARGGEAWPDNGLSREENERLMSTESVTEARRLLRRGAHAVWGNQTG